MKYMDPIFSEHFNIIADYDKGAALEYYFFMKVMQVGIRMTCFRRGFSVTGNTPYPTKIGIQGTIDIRVRGIGNFWFTPN